MDTLAFNDSREQLEKTVGFRFPVSDFVILTESVRNPIKTNFSDFFFIQSCESCTRSLRRLTVAIIFSKHTPNDSASKIESSRYFTNDGANLIV